MKIAFRNIDHNDLAECSRLFVNAFKEAPWNEEWKIDDAFERLNDFLSYPNAIAIKAEIERSIYGFLIGEIQRWERAKVFFLKEMCVATTMQRKGIGKALITRLEGILQEKQASQIYLITHRDNKASKFYSSLGFNENLGMMVAGKSIRKKGI